MGLKRNLSFTFIDKIVTFLIFLVTTMVVSRILTPAELGLLAIAASSIALITMFKNFGFTTYIIKEATLTDSKKSTVFTLSLIISTVLFFIILFVAESISEYYQNNKILEILYVINISVLFSPLHIIASGLLLRNESFKTLAIINISAEMAFFVIVMLFMYFEFGVIGLAIANVTKSLLQIVLMLFLIKKEMIFKLGLKNWKSVTIFGMKMSFLGVIQKLQEIFITLIIGKVLGVGFTAQYDKGRSLPKIVWQVLYPALQTAIFPHYAKQNRDGNLLNKTILHNMQHGLAIFWPVLLTLALVSPSVIFYLYGDQWAAAAPVASLLALSSILTTPVMFVQMGLITTGNENLLVKIQIISKLFIFFGVIIVVDKGIIFVATTILSVNFLYLLMAISISRTLEISIPDFIRSFIKPLFVALFSNLPFFFIVFFYGRTIVDNAFAIILSISTFIILWLISTLYLFPSYREILKAFYNKFSLIVHNQHT